MHGTRFDLPAGAADRALLERALDEAFGYRGDVSITLDDGSEQEGYVFDHRRGPDAESSFVRLVPRDSDRRIVIPYSRIRSVAFTGKDPAAGKTWENWVRRYAEKKLKGEAASIESEPLTD